MSRKGRLFEKLSIGLDLPAETLPGQTIVELLGNRRVLIEHHNGICLYGDNEIHIQVSYGQLCICGCGLKIACMTRVQIIITGQIDGLSVLERR